MVSSAHGRGLGRMVSPFQGSGLSEARCGLSRLMEEPSHRCPWLCAAGRTCLCLLSVYELASSVNGRPACGKEGWRGGTSHADSGGQEYDTGDVWVVTQVAKVKLSFLSWSPSRRVGGYQEHSVLHGSSGLASG